MTSRILISARVLAVAVFSVLTAPQVLQAQQDAPKPQSFESFRLVLSRNVFDPERRALPRPDSGQRSGVPQGMVRSSVTLTGTMVTPSKSLAFFSSTRPGYNKVASVNDQVGDLKVLEIAPNEVMLEQAGQKVALSIGKQLPLAGTEPAPAEAPATGVPGPAPAPVVPGAPEGAAPVSPITSASPGAPVSKEETLRRMMERRQKEMSR
ncbi:MAG: hypothetical protein ACO1QR_10325 [Chthoniobacteraceae bacterium]